MSEQSNSEGQPKVGSSELLATRNDDENDWENEEREWCDTCGNLGVIICHCGGDLCVCEYNGEYPCPDCG